MKKAFTIIEVIVALGIFGLGVLAILGYFAISTQFVRLARQTTVAANLAQQNSEELTALNYKSLAAGSGMRQNFSTDPADPYYPYQKQINISWIDANLAASAIDTGLKKIDVFIYWQGAGGEKSLQMSTIVSKK